MLCQLPFGKTMLPFYHLHTEWTLATELYQLYPGNKQWVLGAATSPGATNVGFCSPLTVWVGTVLVISIKPVEGTNICLWARPLHETSWFWACQCVIEREAIHGNQTHWQILRKGVELPETLWPSSLPCFISLRKVPGQESQKVIEKVTHLLSFIWSSPNLL